MPDSSDKIQVIVAGAVQRGGSVLVSRPATIPLALAAAGGLAPKKPTMWPAGRIGNRVWSDHKFIPGIGSVVGGVLGSTTAAALTTAFGEAYIAALEMLFMKNSSEPPTHEEIAKAFGEKYSQLAAVK